MNRTTITPFELQTLNASDNIPSGARFVVVGNDGFRPCVWGAGATYDEAREDAERWLAEADTSLRHEETETLEVVLG